ncbi:hypothetical protein ISS86_02200 [Candidatus Microgenomates bacterium]|nr:hypothetical protein [Candidatus Microgenomates bacterium]
MKNQKLNFIVLLFYCFIVLLPIASPVWADDCPHKCCLVDDCVPPHYPLFDDTCPTNNWCCESCTYEDGITNPVIGIFGVQAGNLTLAYLLAQFLRVSLVAAGILLLVYLVITGIQWLTSGGEKTAVAAARERMTAAFIGLIIIILVIVVINLINNIFGLNILEPELPTP